MESKSDTNKLIYETETKSQIEIRLVVAKGERDGRGINWEFGISRYKLVYIWRMGKQQGPTVWHRELYLIFYNKP